MEPKLNDALLAATEEDVKEVDELVTRYALNKKQVILMPEGVTRDVISQREVWLKEICAERGYNFSGRLHIKLWDNMRGIAPPKMD